MSAFAALPIFAGPVGPTSTGTAYRLFTTNNVQVSAPTDIGNNGLAVSTAVRYDGAAASTNRGVRWGPDSTPIELGHVESIAGSRSSAFAISANGTAVGFDSNALFAGDHAYAVRWQPDASGTAMKLGSINTPGATGSSVYASAISGGGNFATGRQYKATLTTAIGYRAVRWDVSNGTATELGTINAKADGSAESLGFDVNEFGVVVGSSYLENLNAATGFGDRPIRWNANSTTPVPLGILGTDSGGNTNGTAIAINNAGLVLGNVHKWGEASGGGEIDYGNRAVRYESNSTAPIELGDLGAGSLSTTGTGLNESGVIVGYVSFSGFAGSPLAKAVRWIPGSTQAIELPVAGARSPRAAAVNRIGAVVGGDGDSFISGSAAYGWTPDNVAIRLDTLLAPNSGWTSLNAANGLADTGFVSGWGLFDPDGAGSAAAYPRLFSMLVPQLGTYGLGDANFDTQINFDDLLVLAAHYNQPSNGNIHAGDLDLNGITDFNDLLTLARHYQTAASTLPLDSVISAAFAADFELAQSLVPEPTLLGSVLGTTLALTRRRRGIPRSIGQKAASTMSLRETLMPASVVAN